MRRWTIVAARVSVLVSLTLALSGLIAAVPSSSLGFYPGLRSENPLARTVRALTAPVTLAAQSADSGTLRLAPQRDTFLNVDATNYGTSDTLRIYTWPDYQPANIAVLKFDLSSIPRDAVVQQATLRLALVEADGKSESTYNVSAHKIVNKNPNLAKVTGYTSDGTTPWSSSACCYDGIPLAQADLSPSYATKAINKTPGFKSWAITPMVQEWLADPATNYGVALNADTTILKNRYRYFASKEHPDATLRPYLEIRFSASDATPPSVAVTSPVNGAMVSGTVTVSADAQDSSGVAGVQFQLNGAPLGPELKVAPYTTTLDTGTLTDGSFTLTAVAKDSVGNSAKSAAVTVIVQNGFLLLSPQDTHLNLNTTNYSTGSILGTYTWPDNKVANAILMKFNLSALPAGTVVQEATLHLALVESDKATDPTYTVTAHKVLGSNPDVKKATGTPSTASRIGPRARAVTTGFHWLNAISPVRYDQRAVDKTAGDKVWTVTRMVQEWLDNPASNFGLVLNADITKAADRYRYFASMETPDAKLRPYLRVRLETSGGGPALDTTSPTVSLTSPAAGASVSGTVNITASASDDVGVTGVQFQIDGTNIGTEDTTAPYSIAWNVGAASNGNHTLAAIARDAAGNTTTSGAITVTVGPAGDTTSPTVSMTSPGSGTSVSGTINLTATANDNVGVSSVQFQLDGANVGAQDTAAPYSVSWNSAAASSGSHTLRAVARDAAGNSTTSAAITVTVLNDSTPPSVSNSVTPPSSSGLAARYPGDVGIESDSSVVFVERFDESTLANLFNRWTDVLNGSRMSLSADAPAGSPVGKSLTIPWIGGGVSHGGHLYKVLTPGVDDTLYVRFYIKYPTTTNYTHSGVWMGGYNPAATWPSPQAGILPTGTDRFSGSAETFAATGRFDHYDYWMGMRRSGDGSYWGNTLLNNSNVKASGGQWVCVEQMIKLNNPVSSSNGERAIWLNGVRVSYLGPGFPNGTWSGGNFVQSSSGTPFPGFQWRSDAKLNLNYLWLQNYTPDDSAGTQDMKFAHLVAARSYIGCLSPGGGGGGTPSSDTTRPTVSVTSPAAGATVSGTGSLRPTASDNVGVGGVEFRVDGVNVGAEDTSAPYSISWNTASAANGSHVVTAVARDAASNTTTSAAVTVTVSNVPTESGSGSKWPNEPTGFDSAHRLGARSTAAHFRRRLNPWQPGLEDRVQRLVGIVTRMGRAP